MTNEMKLLMALCDALGFEVEEIYESRIPSGQIIVAHDYKLTKKVDSYITCMMCSTRLEDGAQLDSCECGKPNFLIRLNDVDGIDENF